MDLEAAGTSVVGRRVDENCCFELRRENYVDVLVVCVVARPLFATQVESETIPLRSSTENET